MSRSDPPPAYEVYALRTATQPDRVARENLLRCATPEAPMPQDYFIWAIRGAGRTVVVDTGFPAEVAEARQRRHLHTTVAALARLGIDAATVEDVILTHLHYDHAGGLDDFPRARFHVQDRELRACTGRDMRHAILRGFYRVEDVTAAIRLLYEGRLVLHDGEASLAPGIDLHRIGGHTPGQQIVRVTTQRGAIVLASDGAHFWANLSARNPFPILVDVPAILDGYDRIERLADGSDHVIPGHDPAVLARFPRWKAEADIVALHEAPRAPIDETPALRVPGA